MDLGFQATVRRYFHKPFIGRWFGDLVKIVALAVH